MWRCRKDINENPPFSKLMNSSNFILRTYFCLKSQVCITNLIPGGASTIEKVGESEHDQLQALMPNSR